MSWFKESMATNGSGSVLGPTVAPLKLFWIASKLTYDSGSCPGGGVGGSAPPHARNPTTVGSATVVNTNPVSDVPGRIPPGSTMLPHRNDAESLIGPVAFQSGGLLPPAAAR